MKKNPLVCTPWNAVFFWGRCIPQSLVLGTRWCFQSRIARYIILLMLLRIWNGTLPSLARSFIKLTGLHLDMSDNLAAQKMSHSKFQKQNLSRGLTHNDCSPILYIHVWVLYIFLQVDVWDLYMDVQGWMFRNVIKRMAWNIIWNQRVPMNEFEN